MFWYIIHQFIYEMISGGTLFFQRYEHDPMVDIYFFELFYVHHSSVFLLS